MQGIQANVGGNLTTKHVEEVSLCALFLMEASKREDCFFNVPPGTTAHTIHDSDKDIEKMMGHLQEAKVATVDKERTSPPFTDPVESGWTKLWTTNWLKKALERNLVEESTDGWRSDIDYELADMIV